MVLDLMRAPGMKRDCVSAQTSDARLARAEPLDRATRARVTTELDAAKKRRPAAEARIAGVLRVLAPLSSELNLRAEAIAELFVRRRAWDRPLLAACLWTLVESGRGSELLVRSLGSDDAAYLPLAAWVRSASIGALLTELSMGPSSTAMFSEAARVCRGEANGHRLTELSTLAKESVRIAFIERLAFPLVSANFVIPPGLCAALAVLRTAERHAGRWLALAELAQRTGDMSSRDEAILRSETGSQSARPVWTLVAWALGASTSLAPLKLAPELLARLSDRPSADKDMSFLFRLAHARAPIARAMLEQIAGEPIVTVDGIRSLSALAREYGSSEARRRLSLICREVSEDLRGVAVAALWDASVAIRAAGGLASDSGAAFEAREIASDLVLSRHLPNVAWGALVRVQERHTNHARVLTDKNLRHLRAN
jgi:hypothetical protein